jgi:hypothetical protein
MIVRIEVEDCSEISMFPLLRHIGHTSRYEIPPRPIALREPLDAGALQGLLAAAWRHVRPSECLKLIWNVLELIRFSLLLALVSIFAMLFNEQVQDLRALDEKPGLPTFLFVMAAVMAPQWSGGISLVVFSCGASAPAARTREPADWAPPG